MDVDSIGSVAIGGLSAMALIPKVINILKLYLNIERWIPLISVGMGISLSFIAEWARTDANVQWVATTAVIGLVIGLSAMGNRSADNSLERKANEKQLEQTAIEDQTKTTITTTAIPESVTTDVEVKPVTGGTNGHDKTTTEAHSPSRAGTAIP